uniref:hypothetical protein n=1 Tax=Streptococcus pneumoniae TaxID=1313 RepID=UPI00115661D3
MNKRGLYSKLGISVVGISLLMGVPALIHANELNYGQLSISPIFQGGSYQLNNKSIDISPLLLDLFGNCKKCYTIFMETVY